MKFYTIAFLNIFIKMPKCKFINIFKIQNQNYINGKQPGPISLRNTKVRRNIKISDLTIHNKQIKQVS